VGVMLAQRACNQSGNAVGIAEHIVVPEAEDMITLGLDYCGPGVIIRSSLLPAINLDQESVTMACKVSDEMPDRHLPPKSCFWKMFA